MEKIQMVDLLSSHSAVKQELDAAIYKVIDSSSFINDISFTIFRNNSLYHHLLSTIHFI